MIKCRLSLWNNISMAVMGWTLVVGPVVGQLPERVLQFDPAGSVGKVLARAEGSQDEWKLFGAAWGGVKIPQGTEAGFELEKSRKPTLAPLATLAPGDLQMVRSIDIRLQNGDFASVKQLTGLKSLVLVGAGVQPLAVVHLEGLTQLEELDLSGSILSNKINGPLAGMKGLRRLRLSNTDLGDPTFLQFPPLPHLVELDLSGTSLTNQGLVPVTQSAELVDLDLSKTRISGAGLATLGGLTKLRKLELRSIPLVDADLDILKSMPDLAELNLARTKLTDEGVAILAGLPALRALNLAECLALSDKAVESLGQMKQLKLLGIHQTQISLPAVTRLEEALPECMIVSVKQPQPAELAKVFKLH